MKTKNNNKSRNTRALRKIHVVGPGNGYSNWMEPSSFTSLEDADLIVFTGGEDISPKLYNQPEHQSTWANPHRDRFEVDAYNRALKLNKHMIGICRGNQLLCALNGGILIQDQQNPRMYHPMETYDGQQFIISSLHHQAAYPWHLPEDDYKVLGWADESEYHKGGRDEELTPFQGKEVEIIYFPKTRCLGIQGHPEMMYRDTHPEFVRTIDYLRNMLDAFLVDKLK